MVTRIAIAFVLSASGCITFDGDDSGGNYGGGYGGGSNTGSGSGGSGTGGTSANGCPTGETCSPLTPGGLEFPGAVPVSMQVPNGVFNDVNNHIANGGVDDITIRQWHVDSQTTEDFALPFSAASSDTSVLAVVGSDAPAVTVRGLGGTAYLRIVDPANGNLYDRAAYASSALATIAPITTRELVTAADTFNAAADQFVFAPGDQTIGFALLNSNTPRNRLVDTSTTLVLAGATQLAWDQLAIPAATVGHKTVAVTVAGIAHSVDIETVAHADEVKPLWTEDGLACFGAYAHGAFISGIPWTFSVGGITYANSDTFFGANCVFAPPGSNGVFTVMATAGGKSAMATTTAPQAHAQHSDQASRLRSLIAAHAAHAH